MSSSDFEGLPLTILEAMSMNLPVVATSVGGLPEVVIDGKTGFLVPPRSPDLLAKQIAVLVGNSNLHRAFQKEGRLLVESRFSMQRMQRELEDIYNTITN